MITNAHSMGSSRRVKVGIVDDSALVRSLLRQMISEQPDMEVVGVAPDPIAAREMIRSADPDVLTLDVEMPKMNGLEFLEKLMRLRPMPVVMVSTLTERGSDITVRALELGAVDFVAKPKVEVEAGLRAYCDELLEKIRHASKARVRRLDVNTLTSTQSSGAEKVIRSVIPSTSTEKLMVVGSSTGGTEALKVFLSAVPADAPAIMIVQHMPESFTASLARRLDSLSRVHVKEAVDGERVLPGHAYIAPGHSHLLLARSGANYVCRLSQAEPVNRHRPSVDVLFQSAASVAGRNALGIIMTGMGKDGAKGLLEMKEAGATTLGQDEATCVVYGMPREAMAIGAVSEEMPLEKLAPRAMEHILASGRGLRI